MSYSPESLTRSVVVFSRNYLPISNVDTRRAIILLVTGKAEPLDSLASTYREVKAANFVLQVPDTIRLTARSLERFWKPPAVNRREVLKRDKYRCQYCGSRSNLTLDHIFPRSRGGRNTWENLVTACESCNGSKGDRTPREAGMSLKSVPKAPIHPAILFAEQFWQTRSPS
ncbi:HNH endonuclease [Pannus brasiliensis CCIBt3594]|uniref:HNH endonuclease n=1 Tax=Pannus brasiliensis CCIBt3594 TaxID=1427578 RepID=A0AAW9QSU8_9CHRO